MVTCNKWSETGRKHSKRTSLATYSIAFCNRLICVLADFPPGSSRQRTVSWAQYMHLPAHAIQWGWHWSGQTWLWSCPWIWETKVTQSYWQFSISTHKRSVTFTRNLLAIVQLHNVNSTNKALSCAHIPSTGGLTASTHILRNVSSVLEMDPCSSPSNLSMQFFMKGLSSSQWYMCCFLWHTETTANSRINDKTQHTKKINSNWKLACLLVYTVGNDQVEWEVSSKHLFKMLCQFSEHSTISVVAFTLELQHHHNPTVDVKYIMQRLGKKITELTDCSYW